MRTTLYYKVMAICAFILVATTLIIHMDVFVPNVTTYDESIALHNNSINTLGKWIIIAHCLLVLVTMWGIKMLHPREHVTRLNLGFLFYAVFTIVEIFRQFLEMFYLNGLKSRYEESVTLEHQDYVMMQIESFNYFSYALFALFIFAFALGNLLYGLSHIKGKKWDKILGVSLLLWALFGGLSLGNEFWEISWLNKLLGPVNFVYQPLVRFYIGYWFVTKLWDSREELSKEFIKPLKTINS